MSQEVLHQLAVLALHRGSKALQRFAKNFQALGNDDATGSKAPHKLGRNDRCDSVADSGWDAHDQRLQTDGVDVAGSTGTTKP